MIANRRTINILGTKFHHVTRSEAAAFIVKCLQERKKASVFTPNPEIVMEAYHDTKLQAVLNDSELVVPDGIGVVIASKILGQPLPERVAGYDLVQEVFRQIENKEVSVYFLGAGQGVAELAKEKMLDKYSNLKIVGVHNGFFDHDQDIVERINATDPDFLLVGLGAPKQEYWIKNNRDRLKANVLMGVGGSFDGMSGKVRRAPKLFIKLGLEWFYRLITQPTRAKRMLKLPIFMFKVIVEGKKYL
ncbi:WecB/TagA/CpsF family glycosyltransferase [Petrocella sp. FN5]|uniref:WecB/TagA/CpsF family glycosyltransferase n=1 Tax=Petrocella sp. FN5 TaxID=3032002 RepID=UPI0023DAD5EF|nr:WecB/TagA/CpsF family glycosyltransferase [Petrocella sp. FN5]MDF1615954.1 WecB/TagA/CpsF family glycosyltransferase [Petrocella sp. FN5]